MIKLLISVKNAQEALLAADAGADLIDLKDPEVGALGNLDAQQSLAIIRVLQDKCTVSATVGDTHQDWPTQLALIHEKVSLGLSVIKLPVTPYFEEPQYLKSLAALVEQQQVKLIAVFFADETIDLQKIDTLVSAKFYGAMLDVKQKSTNLVASCGADSMASFVKLCKKHQLQVGLAGALRIEWLDKVIVHQPDYVGFRSGVCENDCRQHALMHEKVKEISDKLYKHNNLCVKMSTED